MQNAFEQFIKERQHLTNVSPATMEWYRQKLAWWGSESPTNEDLKIICDANGRTGPKAFGLQLSYTSSQCVAEVRINAPGPETERTPVDSSHVHC